MYKFNPEEYGYKLSNKATIVYNFGENTFEKVVKQFDSHSYILICKKVTPRDDNDNRWKFYSLLVSHSLPYTDKPCSDIVYSGDVFSDFFAQLLLKSLEPSDKQDL